MWRACQALRCYRPPDLHSKTLLERAVRQRVREGARREDIDTTRVAQSLGLLPPDSADVAAMEAHKEELQKILREQRLRRIARQEAFQEWQRGQREKSAANRLTRQSKTAEKFKRKHYHSRKGKILPLDYGTSDTPVDVEEAAARGEAERRYAHYLARRGAPRQVQSSTEFLAPSDRAGSPFSSPPPSPHSPRFSLGLRLEKR